MIRTRGYLSLLIALVAFAANGQWSNPDGQGRIYYNGGSVGIGTSNPLGELHVAGLGVNGWVYFSGNVNGAGNPQNYQGLAFGWNRSGGSGESTIVYNKSLGADPRLDIVSFDGSAYNIEMSMKGGRAGIGTISPIAKFHSHETAQLGATVGSYQLIHTVSGTASNFFAHNQWLVRDDASSTFWWTARLHDGISIDVSFFVPGQDTRTWWERDPMNNIQSWGNANQTYLTIDAGNVGIGTTEPDALLTVKGDIHTREVRVDMNGSVAGDYVFQNDYDLLSLEDLESFINKNSHLPDVPSASEMEANGLNLKEMNLLLLKKVEELTLHIIEINKKVETLQKENAIQKIECEKLKRRKGTRTN